MLRDTGMGGLGGEFFYGHGQAAQVGTRARRIFLAKGYTVFNLEQTSGLGEIRAKLEVRRERGFEPLEECERVVRSTGAVIRENGVRASYSPSLDVITMPPRSRFHRIEDFYATLYHEACHWSGAAHRLNRDLGAVFGDTWYAQEELVAELGACFLAARTGIEHATKSASYIGSCLAALREDRRFIFAAAKLATQAAAYVYGRGGGLDRISRAVKASRETGPSVPLAEAAKNQ